MYRKFFALSLAVLLALSLVACGPDVPDGGNESQGQSTPETTEPSQNSLQFTDGNHFYQELSENLVIDADVVPQPEGVVPGVYEADIPVLNDEVLNNFFAAIEDSVATVTADEYSDELKIWRYVANTEKGALFGLDYRVDSIDVPLYQINYSSADWRWYNNVLTERSRYDQARTPGDDNSHRYEDPKDFAFATKEEAETQVRSLLATLGIHNAVLIETLYMDHKIMAEEEKSPIMLEKMTAKGTEPDFKPQWTEADDAYCFTFNFAQDGILMQSQLDSGRDVSYLGCNLEVLYNQSGLISLTVSQPWVFEKQIEAAESIITPDEAIERAKEILQFSVTPYKRTADELALRYYYRQEHDKVYLRPCWIVSVLGEDIPSEFMGMVEGEPYDEYSFIVIDAITGQEL